jgi:hypothetical protein
VGYLSKELDQVIKGWPGCLRAVTTVSLLVPKAQKTYPKPGPDNLYPTQPRRNFKLKKVVTLIVLGITTLIAALAGSTIG